MAGKYCKYGYENKIDGHLDGHCIMRKFHHKIPAPNCPECNCSTPKCDGKEAAIFAGQGGSGKLLNKIFNDNHHSLRHRKVKCNRTAINFETCEELLADESMFEILKQRLLNVQQDITGKTSQRFQDQDLNTADFDAGAKLLEHYQSHWTELHRNAETNAKKATEVDILISNLHSSCMKKCASINEMSSRLSSLPNLSDSLQSLAGKIGDLQGLFESVENSLVKLEDIIEAQLLEEKQLEQRYLLAKYKENKLRYLEELKVQLEAEHEVKLSQFEFKRKKELQERQATFQEVFEEEMEHYRQHGHVKTLDAVCLATDNLKLEDVELDCDSGALDQFLTDSNSTETP